jgi:hypothetical protein
MYISVVIKNLIERYRLKEYEYMHGDLNYVEQFSLCYEESFTAAKNTDF